MYYFNTQTGTLQSFPKPTGDEWIAVTEERPGPNYVVDMVDGFPVWVEAKEVREFKHFSGQAKINLFTEQERRNVLIANHGGDIDVGLFLIEYNNSDYLTYSNPKMEMGLELLALKDIITRERKSEIIAQMTAEYEPNSIAA